MRQSRWLLVLFLALIPARADGRFLDSDADEIDREDRLGTTSFTDALSYRFPPAFQDLWDDADIGFRASAGSFTVSRFDYAEDVKVQTPVSASAGIAFFQARDEDMLEQRTERELRLWAQPTTWPLRLALLGDGGTYKEYGDLGAAASFWIDRRHWLEAHYWSVDHYYNEKRSQERDLRPENTTTRGIAGDWSDGALRLRFAGDIDTPLRWTRLSRGYLYEYARRTAFGRVDVGDGDGLALTLSGSYEWKRESKQWVDLAAGAVSKGLERTAGELGAALIDREGLSYTEYGATFIAREARYSLAVPPGFDPETAPEPPSPPLVSRRELGLRIVRLTPVARAGQALEYGILCDGVDLREDQAHWRQLESKALFAWDYAFNAKSHALLSSTWDLAKIIRNYPYDDERTRPFRPWGGGNLQLIATF